MRIHSFLGLAFLGPLTALSVQASAQTPPSGGQPPVPPANTASSPDVNLSPKRVVIDAGRRSGEEIVVFNKSTATTTYAIELVDRVMTSDGDLKGLDQVTAAQKAKHKSATSFLRYSPRRVTLKPGEAQTVRIQARRPADLAPGEYRAHFSVSAVPPEDSGLDIATAAGAVGANEIGIRLTPVFGISIPIIVREGELPVQSAIGDVKMIEQGGRRAINLAVTRNGQRSLYGDVEVFLLGSGEPRRVAIIRGIGVYPEIERRQITAVVAEDAPKLGAGSRLRIVFKDDDFKKGAVLAQTDVTL